VNGELVNGELATVNGELPNGELPNARGARGAHPPTAELTVMVNGELNVNGQYGPITARMVRRLGGGYIGALQRRASSG
jgi:hypothetical protein